jgi:hypothetical protein
MINCPMRNDSYTGYCDGCNERMDCMLREILLKLKELELKVAQTKTATFR